MGLGRAPAFSADGHLYICVFACREGEHKWNCLSSICVLWTLAMDFFFQRRDKCRSRHGCLSHPAYKNVFPAGNHPSVISGGGSCRFCNRLRRISEHVLVLQGDANLEFALRSAHSGGTWSLRCRHLSSFRGHPSTLSRRWTCVALRIADMDVRDSRRLLVSGCPATDAHRVPARARSRCHSHVSRRGAGCTTSRSARNGSHVWVDLLITLSGLRLFQSF